MDLAHAIAKKFGKTKIQTEIDHTTTHLLLGKNSRTLKTIVAIARGMHVVHPEWLTQSNKAGRWLCEYNFNVDMWFPGNTLYKRAHENSDQLFKKKKKFFIGTKTNFPEKILREVIEVLGGQVCHSMSGVDICISGYSMLPQLKNIEDPPPVVMETWVFDALSQWQCPPPADYQPK